MVSPAMTMEATMTTPGDDLTDAARGALYGFCTDDGTALDVRTTWQAETGNSLMERFCPLCGLVQ